MWFRYSVFRFVEYSNLKRWWRPLGRHQPRLLPTGRFSKRPGLRARPLGGPAVIFWRIGGGEL